MSLIEKLIAAGYSATAAQVQELAAVAGAGVQAGATYLRVLIVAAQGVKRRPALKAIDAAHATFYPAIIAGVGGDGKEAQRRATFARSAASTLRAFVRNGGELKGVDPMTATKGTLRKATRPAEPAERNARAFARSLASVHSSAKRLASRDPPRARVLIVDALEGLQAMLGSLPKMPAPARRPRAPAAATEVRPH